MQRVPSEAIAPFRPRVAKPKIHYLVRCVVRYALEHYGERVGGLPYEDLFLCMKSGVFRARQYGLEDFESIAVFVGLMLDTAPNFDEHEVIRRGLNDPKLHGVDKLDALLETTSEESWLELIEQYDEQAWSFGLTEENELAEFEDLKARIAIFAPMDDSKGFDTE